MWHVVVELTLFLQLLHELMILAQAHIVGQQSVNPMNSMTATCLYEIVQILVFDVVVDTPLVLQHV